MCGAGTRAHGAGNRISSVFANVFCRDDVAVVDRSDSRTINARAKSCGSDAVDPGVNVSLLFRQHSPALLLVEKDNGCAGKSLAAGSCSGCPGVRSSEASSVRHGLQLSVEAAVEEHKKSEPRGVDGGAVANPGVRILARRIIQPVPGISKSLVKSLEIGIAGIIIAVKAEVGVGGILAAGKRQDDRYKCNPYR